MMIDWGKDLDETRDFDRCVWECEGGRTYCERICR